jgi:hypothetical protein
VDWEGWRRRGGPIAHLGKLSAPGGPGVTGHQAIRRVSQTIVERCPDDHERECPDVEGEVAEAGAVEELEHELQGAWEVSREVFLEAPAGMQ